MNKKQLKRLFNKNIFKDKSFIKMVCFTIVLLLVLVLGNNFGFVSADGDTSSCVWLTEEEYTNSDVYDSHNYFQGYMNLFSDINNSNATLTSNVIMNHDWSTTFTGANTADVDVGDFKYYLIIGSAYPSSWRIYFFPDDVYMYVETSALYTYYDIMNSQDFYYCDITPWGNGTTVESPYCIFPDTLLHALGQWSGNFQDYYMSVSTGQSTFICSTNMPVYTYQTNRNWTYGSYFNDLMAYIDGDDSANIVNVNYRYDSDECMPLNGLDGLENCDNYGGGSNDDTSYENNMYANSADWVLNNFTGDIAHNYKSVSATFNSDLNEYINETENLDDFSLEFDCNIYIEFYYCYVLNRNDVQVALNNNFASVTANASSADLLTNRHKWSCTYYIPESIQSYSDFDHLNCQTFANNGYSKTFNFKNLFTATLPKGYFTDSNGKHDLTVTLNQLMTLIDNEDIYFVDGVDKSFKITLTATIVHDSTNTTSGSYSETFDLFTGESVIDDSSMLINYNPDNDNTDEQSNLPATTNNNNPSATASTGNVTQTVNVSNEGAKYIPSIISSLIPSSFGDTTTGLASRFTTLVDSNNFITVMANTVPAIPTTVWTYLTEYLGISLYLLACAFVLRLILDLL